ncbi:hypothetical protein ABMA28_002491 [Loxostege sticticalis]|uniref:Odorant binding protein n=1 Tax=Loxostege sticticalis TaxID=481309 RepID=A0ABD0SY81_LOXSC
MFGVIGLFVLMFATCRANVAVSRSDTPQVLCGLIPDKLNSCGHLPTIVSAESAKKCGSSSNSCQRMTCIFQESGWMDGKSVNNAKLSEYLDHFSSEHPDWTAAIQHAKTTCLVPNLPAQGFHLNCPAYDVVTCVFRSFVWNIPPSLWSSSSDCEPVRQYAAACPVCPADCFSPAIPVGSCNACRALPRSP